MSDVVFGVFEKDYYFLFCAIFRRMAYALCATA